MPIFEDQYFKDYVNSLPAATENDLAAGNNMPVVSASEVKKMGGENVAKAAEVGNAEERISTINKNNSFVTTYADTANGNVIISNGVVTGYGTETYWNHAELERDNGLFITFLKNQNASDYVYFVDNENKILKTLSFSAAAEYQANVELVFPPNAVKAIVKSVNYPEGVGYVKVSKSVGVAGVEKEIRELAEALPRENVQATTDYGFPTFDAKGVFTGYGTQSYWKHSEIEKGVCLSVNLYVGTSSNDYIIYVDEKNRIVSKVNTKSPTSSAGYYDYPLDFPVGSSKAIVMSNNYPDGRGTIIVRKSFDPSKQLTKNLQSELATVKNKLEKIEGVETLNGYPVISNGVITGYGTQEWWARSEIQKDDGLFVNFTSATNAHDYVWFVDDTGKIYEKISIENPKAERIVERPLYFPEGSTKAVVISAYNGIWSDVPVTFYKSAPISLPSYWLDHIKDKALEINDKYRQVLNGCSFAFITDLHWGTYSTHRSGLILGALLDKTNVPFAVSGGDYPYAVGESIETLKNDLDFTREWVGQIGKERLYPIRGNHDWTMAFGTTTSINGATFGRASVADFFSRNLPKDAVVNKDHSCYYVDDNYSGTRFFFVNSEDEYIEEDSEETIVNVGYNVTDEQLQWLVDNTKNLQNKKIVVFSHVAADAALSNGASSQSEVHNILKAIKNKTAYSYNGITADYSATTCEVVCQISGHEHKDGSHVLDGVLNIITGCDCRLGEGINNRHLNTIRENLFDVFVVDYDRRRIQAIRVGYGSNREWSF